MSAPMPRCPICGTTITTGGSGQHLPFCSLRCKLVDLDRWLSGDYRIPGPAAEVIDLEGPQGGGPDDPRRLAEGADTETDSAIRDDRGT